MNIPRRLLPILLLVAMCCLSNAQPPEDKDLRRWLSKKPIIEAISVEGNHFFSDSRIRKSLFSKESNIFRAIRSDRQCRIHRENMLRDTSEIKYLYLSSGFLGVNVSEKFIPVPPDSNALIEINIGEGRRFFYDTVSFSGQFDKMLNPDFFRIMDRFKRGKAVDPFKLRQAVYDIKSILANRGYPYAQTDYFIDTLVSDSLANVRFAIQADSLVHFGEIKMVGVKNFDTSLVRRELTYKKGDIYRREDIIKSQKRLLETGYYLTLRLGSSPADTTVLTNRLNPDFSLILTEKKPRYISIRTGAAQDSIKDLTWSLSASWAKRNFLKSRFLEITARSSFVIFTEWRLKDHSYSLSISEPWFLGIRMPLTLTGQIEPGVRSLLQPYRKQTWSVSVTTTRMIGEKLKILTGLQYEEVKIYGVSALAEKQIRSEQGISVRRNLYLNVLRDTRNDIFIPSKGSVTILRSEYFGGFLGGDDSFYLLETSWSRYQRFWPGWISATRLKWGIVQAFGNSTSVPTDVRFYLGGANTIRGFSEKDLGPKSSLGNPIGAEVIIIANQEFRYPIFGKLWGSIFADVGNGYSNRSSIKWNNLAVSFGVGLQFISPAGPIRLDYARHIKTKSIDSGSKIHFTILYAF